MVEETPHVRTNPDAAEDGESEGLDFERIRETVAFVLSAARRRPKVASMTFVTVAALGVAVSATMPRTYSAQVRLLAQRPSTIRVLSSANAFGMEAVDNPTKNVASMIMRRDNIVALAKEANLAKRFNETRPAPLRLKDRAMALLFGAPSDEDRQAGMVATLESKLDVATDEGTSTVTIRVDWSNPQIAYDLVTLVQKNFLEARYDSDVGVINDSIAVLGDHAKSELDRVDSVLAEYQTLLTERAKTAQSALGRSTPAKVIVTSGPRPVTSALPHEPVVDPDLTRALESKRLQIRALEEAQQRTLDALKQQLAQAQLSLTPLHPTVIALQERVDAMSQPSPELARLRNDERSLMAQIAPPRLAVPPGPTAAALPFRTAAPTDANASSSADLAPPPPNPILEADGVLQLAQSKLGAAIHAYQDAVARIDSAKVELDITRAAYKYRYTVVSPAELPNKPKKATAQLVGVGSVVGGALLALLLAAFSDLVGGLVLESWQVRRRLKLEVIGELDNPS